MKIGQQMVLLVLKTVNYVAKRKHYFFRQAFFDGAVIKISLSAADEDIEADSENPLSFLDQTLDWRSQVRDLLVMSSNQYSVQDKDWHSEQSAWLCKYGHQTIVVYCILTKPTAEEINRVYNFFSNNSDADIARIIVAIEDDIFGQTLPKVRVGNLDVELKYKRQWLDNLVDFTNYFQHLNKQFNEMEISTGDGLTLNDTYTHSSADIVDLKSDIDKHHVKNTEQYLLDWVRTGPAHQHMTLLGEYGQGKSVLSLKLALSMINNGCDRIPIIIELRGKSPRNETVADLIASWAARFHINVRAMQRLLQEGRLLVILEGFDEMDMVGNALRRLEHFKRLWEFARYEKSKIIITGRPNLFLDNNEARQYLHLNNNSSSIFTVKAVNLRPFNRQQIKQALRNCNEVTKTEILELHDIVGDGDNFVDLISRPSTLYQTSVIWQSLDKNHINSASVINEFINHAYKRQSQKLQTIGPTGIEPFVLSAKEREYFMLGVALGMVKQNGYSNQITKTDLENIIAKLLDEIPNEVSKDHATGTPLLQRLNDEQSPLGSVFNDVRASGILVRDLSSSDSFKFAHKSFLELLFAKVFVGTRTDDENQVVCNSIVLALGVERKIFELEYSVEVIKHIAEMFIREHRTTDRTAHFDNCKYIIDKIDPWLRAYDFFLYGYGKVGLLIVLVILCIIMGLSSVDTYDLVSILSVFIGVIGIYIGIVQYLFTKKLKS